MSLGLAWLQVRKEALVPALVYNHISSPYTSQRNTTASECHPMGSAWTPHWWTNWTDPFMLQLKNTLVLAPSCGSSMVAHFWDPLLLFSGLTCIHLLRSHLWSWNNFFYKNAQLLWFMKFVLQIQRNKNLEALIQRKVCDQEHPAY